MRTIPIASPSNNSVLFRWLIEPDDAEVRLDVFLADAEDPPLTRSQVRKRLDAGEVTVNGEIVKAGYKLREDDDVEWRFAPPRTPDMKPQDLEVPILFENEHLAVVDKPAGMVVHPAPGHPDGTLVNALLFQLDDLSSVGGERRPGIVHRIDKDTSGALVVSKDDLTHRHLAALFKAHDIERAYHALVYGPSLPDSETIETLHGRDPNHRIRFTGRVDSGKRAVTHYKVLERFQSGCALVECRLETGRTHQIRVHLSERNAPLLGDQVYAGKKVANSKLIGRQALHARSLGFTLHDGTDVFCESPYPDDFAAALEALRAGKDWE